MVEAAVADVAGLEAGSLEIDHGGASYTADTLGALAERHPGAELFTIVGDDAAAGHRHAGSARARWWPGRAWSSSTVPATRSSSTRRVDWIRIEVPRLEVSSTDLRARFSDGRPLDYLVTDPVLDVIAARQLYRSDS